MGASQSSSSNKPQVPPAASKESDQQHQASDDDDAQPFPVPTGHEYDAIDRIASELPNVIDDESRQQVEDYRQACNNGKGPMVCPDI